jgi:hypothetical protein
LKKVGFTHPQQPRDEHEEQHQNKVGRVVVRPVRSVSDNPFQPATQTQLVTKPLDQEQTAEVGKRVRLERKIKCLQAFSHGANQPKPALGLAPITDQNGRCMARGQNVTFFNADKPITVISSALGAFFRLKRWEWIQNGISPEGF